jgi:hypothetical protein
MNLKAVTPAKAAQRQRLDRQAAATAFSLGCICYQNQSFYRLLSKRWKLFLSLTDEPPLQLLRRPGRHSLPKSLNKPLLKCSTGTAVVWA